MLAEIPATEYRQTLDRCADDLLWEAGVNGPPIDAYRLAEKRGITVARDTTMAARARFGRLAADPGRPPLETILVGNETRPERRHFAIAHEVGEANAHRVFDALGVDPREAAAGTRETVANALAGRLLAPQRWMRGVWRDTDGDLFEMKQVFATASHELIARRVLECAPRALIVTVTDQGRVTWRRWNLSGPTPPRLRLEIDCWRHTHEAGEPAWGDGRDEANALAGSPIERVRCWPIHEPEWRREISFTELVSDEPEWL